MKFGGVTIALFAAVAFPSTTYADSIYEIAAGNDSFSNLAAAVDAAGLKEVLDGDGTFTVFAPPDTAFAALPDGTVDKLLKPEWVFHLQDLLKYHTLGSIVQQSDLTDGLEAETLNEERIVINLPNLITTVSNTESNIGTFDIGADNGIVHAVDAVLLPTSATSNIVDIAAGNEIFATLVAAVTKAGLIGDLSGEGPLTVFGKFLDTFITVVDLPLDLLKLFWTFLNIRKAPTDDAFDALSEGTLDSLLLPANKQKLIDILTYHVVADNAHSSTLTAGPARTLNGATLDISTDGGVMVNDANVVKADILASNGIIHVIDKVLLPPEEEEATFEEELDLGWFQAFINSILSWFMSFFH